MLITAIEPRRKSLSQLYIDGEEAVKIDTETVIKSGFRIGSEISDSELFELIKASDKRRANEKALYLLEHRSHSKKELADKIARTAASREAAKAAAERMEELGLVDDEQYARDLAHHLFVTKKYGPFRVKQELRLKGIDPEISEPIVEEYLLGLSQEDNIRQILEKKYRGFESDEKIRRRAVSALQRMGYDYDSIKEALSSFSEE